MLRGRQCLANPDRRTWPRHSKHWENTTARIASRDHAKRNEVSIADGHCPRAAAISKRLRRERELALCGDIDFIPTEEYSAADSGRAYDEAAWVVALAGEVIDPLGM